MREELYEARHFTYCYKGTNILINKLDIKDIKILYKLEKQIVLTKLFELRKNENIGKFDVEHFCSIHKFLFEDIYCFAGLLRTENIAKDNFRFAEWQYLDNELLILLDKLKKEECLSGLSKLELAKRLAYYMAELNVLHPFREGNGRTIREFIRQLALKNGYNLDLQNIDSEDMLLASIKSVVDIEPLEEVIFKCLKQVV